MARRAFPLPVRRAAIWPLTALAALALTGPASAASRALPWPSVAEIARAGTIADTEVFSLQGVAQQRPGYWGGAIVASTGETVTVYASSSYVEDPARTQAWAEYLVKLSHGTELAGVRLYVAPLEDVQRVCGRGALACYSPSQATIFSPGEAPDPETSAEAIVAHEIGHHVAANRINTPWPAVDWGTKRWATYLQVCARSETGEVYPGDEQDNYRLNPGEGFAEAYRVLNEQRLGATATPWGVVETLFEPDATALELLERDVVQPWTANTATTLTGRVTAKAPRRTTSFATPLDGSVQVTLRVPAKSRMSIQLLEPGSLRVLARATASAPYAATVRTTACGQRSLLARVTAVKGAGTFRLNVSRP